MCASVYCPKLLRAMYLNTPSVFHIGAYACAEGATLSISVNNKTITDTHNGPNGEWQWLEVQTLVKPGDDIHIQLNPYKAGWAQVTMWYANKKEEKRNE